MLFVRAGSRLQNIGRAIFQRREKTRVIKRTGNGDHRAARQLDVSGWIEKALTANR
jgi:hypothetical protein